MPEPTSGSIVSWWSPFPALCAAMTIWPGRWWTRLRSSAWQEKVRVVGQDGDLAACQRIVEGTQSMTVYKPVDKLASRAAQETVRLIKGETLECEYFLTEDGGSDSPISVFAPVAVTLDNMQSVIIDSGFHLREDVYLNRPDLMKP